MSLYVVYKTKNAHGIPKELEHHIPFKGNLPDLKRDEIDFIQADGDELQAIKETFGDSIPLPYLRRVACWYGDIAKTIYFNLR